jgi:anti-anti-sigma factor
VTSPIAHVELEDRPGVVIARLHGEFDSSNTAELLLPLAAEAAGRSLILVVDDVQYMDSAGMAAIEKLRGSTALTIVVPEDSIVRRSLEVVGFHQLLPVFERLEDVPASDVPTSDVPGSG